MSKENNKMQVDIDNLFKQNVNDLLSIKELYKRIEELGEKITQIKYIDNTLVKKIKKEYEKLKKIILDENVQVKIINDIETINSHLETIMSFKEKDLETSINKSNQVLKLIDVEFNLNGKTITISKPLKIIGKNAKIRNGILKITSDNVNISSITFEDCIIALKSYNNFTFKKNKITGENNGYLQINLNNVATDINNIDIEENEFNLSKGISIHTSYNNYENYNILNNLTIKRNIFKKINDTALFIHSNLNNAYITENYFELTQDFGINLWKCHQNSSCNIDSNYFNKIGYWRDGTEKTSEEVINIPGCCAIYSDKELFSVFITKNKIFNVVENSIEGFFGKISNNYIENSLHDCIWGRHKIIENNYCINPLTYGYSYTSDSTFSNSIIRNNVFKNTSSNSSAIGIFVNSIDNVIINNNEFNGFKYDIEVSPNTSMNNFKFNNESDSPNFYKTLSNIKGKNINLGFTPLNILNNNFSSWENQTTLTNWEKQNCNLSQVDNGQKTYIPNISKSDNYDPRIKQIIEVPRYGVLRFRIKYKTSQGVMFSIHFLNNDNSSISNSSTWLDNRENTNDEIKEIDFICINKYNAPKARIEIGASNITDNNAYIYSINGYSL